MVRGLLVVKKIACLPCEKSVVTIAAKQKAREAYILDGPINDVPSHHVWLLDCRFHHWRPDPPICVAYEFAAAATLTAGATSLVATLPTPGRTPPTELRSSTLPPPFGNAFPAPPRCGRSLCTPASS
ncbi:hypothetical protein Fmac_018655 [Flemingia macrophylla]|uniref:Uncharacterized protein n=1 Tax=Flemingia macrophylla TaxID=520843 RepID=A0ABD1M5K4_9FABA